jgi:hypothetical protein
MASTAILIMRDGMAATLPLLQALRGLCNDRNEDRHDAASVIRGSSSIRKKTVSSNHRERAADSCGLWNVVVLDLAFYELRSSTLRLISSNFSIWGLKLSSVQLQVLRLRFVQWTQTLAVFAQRHGKRQQYLLAQDVSDGELRSGENAVRVSSSVS